MKPFVHGEAAVFFAIPVLRSETFTEVSVQILNTSLQPSPTQKSIRDAEAPDWLEAAAIRGHPILCAWRICVRSAAARRGIGNRFLELGVPLV